MNQTQEQINTYSKLVDPKPTEEPLKMESRKDLESQVEETRKRYLALNETMHSKQRESQGHWDDADRINLEIQGLKADHREVPVALTQRHQSLIKQAETAAEEAGKADTEKSKVNAGLRELEIKLKNWIEPATQDDLNRLHGEIQDTQANIDRINKKIEEINNVDRSGYTGKLAELRAEREELAAQVALEEEPEDKLAKLDKKIREVEELCRADQTAMQDQAGVISGLQKRLNEAETRLSRKQAEISQARHDYLLNQAEKTAKQFIAESKKLAKLDRKMKAYVQVLHLEQNGDDSLKIPAYSLPAFTEACCTPDHNYSDPRFYGSKFHSCEAEEKQIRDDLESYKN